MHTALRACRRLFDGVGGGGGRLAETLQNVTPSDGNDPDSVCRVDAADGSLDVTAAR